MDLKKTYRAYLHYKDEKGKKYDLEGVTWPLDTYRIIQAESVSDCIKRFKELYPDLRMLGVAGTFDLTDEILIELMERQGHKPEFEKSREYKSLNEVLDK